MEEKYSDAEIVPGPDGEVKIRLKTPRGDEMIGIVEQRVGGNRMLINCSDGKTHNGRIPGRLRRALWIREGDVVIVKPWEFDKEKVDVLYKYNKNLRPALKSKGYLDKIKSDF
jgi:translation initiation factor 1A